MCETPKKQVIIKQRIKAVCDICYEDFDKEFKVSGFGCCVGKFCTECKSLFLQKCPYCRQEVKTEIEFKDALAQKETKYFDLVWYARKNYDEVCLYKDLALKKIVLDHCKRIEEAYPEEIDGLQSITEGNWTHGFNSGMLACLRYVSTCLNDEPVIDDDTGSIYNFGGIANAEEEFPFLDT